MIFSRLLAVLVLLSATAGLVHLRGDHDRVPPSTPLSEFPQQIGPWTGSEMTLDPAVLDILGKGFFLNRRYDPPLAATAESDGNLPVSLFIGYFPTQRTGQSIHSPQNCLPGSGWVFETSGTTQLRGPEGKTLRVGEYLISNGLARAEVLYWYRTHGRSVANDYAAKGYMLMDSIRYNRTDAALIRVVTPLATGEDVAAARLRVIRFSERITPLLPSYIPD